MGVNRRTPQMQQALADTRAADERRAHCEAIVARWNAAPTHDWSPSIGTVLTAGYRWLKAYCAGCDQVKPIDLAAIDIHPRASLTSLTLLLRCRQCHGCGPLPQLIGLYRLAPSWTAARASGGRI
jgi:hypothetical protein